MGRWAVEKREKGNFSENAVPGDRRRTYHQRRGAEGGRKKRMRS
jgi:hypothetical protein